MFIGTFDLDCSYLGFRLGPSWTSAALRIAFLLVNSSFVLNPEP